MANEKLTKKNQNKVMEYIKILMTEQKKKKNDNNKVDTKQS